MFSHWFPTLSNTFSPQLARTVFTPLWKRLPDFPIRWWNPLSATPYGHQSSASPICSVSPVSSASSSLSPISDNGIHSMLRSTRHEGVASLKLPPILDREHVKPNNVILPSLSELGLLNFGRSHDYDTVPMLRPPPFALLPSLSRSPSSDSDCSSETTLEDALERLSLSESPR